MRKRLKILCEVAVVDEANGSGFDFVNGTGFLK